MAKSTKDYTIDTFDNGTATQLVENYLFQLDPATLREDYEENMLQFTNEVAALNERKVFLEGVAVYLGQGDTFDMEVIFKEVQRRYADKGITLSKTVKGWFRKDGVPPSTDPKYRYNLYDFCIAMGMDWKTTAEFFLKVFLTIPYNYKNRDDAIYFYCLKESRPYSVVKQMRELAESFEETNSDVELTREIGVQIGKIESDEEFLHYLKNHCYDKKHQYATAKRKIAEWIEKNKLIVSGKDQHENELLFNDLGTTKVSALLKAILGYAYQELDEAQRERMKKCGLPVFPRDGDVDKILAEDKDVSFDVLRRTLIIMHFYNYYREAQLASKRVNAETEAQIQERLWDFYDALNAELAQCGFVQLYARNPFDWIVLFCANSPSPTDCLKAFIQKRYLGNLDD